MQNKEIFIILFTWVILLIIPAIIVAGFYLIFGNLNYFNLSDTGKGIIASGPIAAYIFLVFFGYKKIYKDLAAKILLKKSQFRHFFGKWNFTSYTTDKSENREGEAEIQWTENGLKIKGTFIDQYLPTGSWYSEMYFLEPDELVFYYKLQVLNPKYNRNIEYDGVCRLKYKKAASHELEGQWRLVGNNTSGYMKFVKKIRYT